jgi:nucleotidyltransferase/DNA polymerase involved in DNA repair
VGEKSLAVLNREGIYKIGDLAKYDISGLIRLFGKNGEHLWLLANGIDDREVEEEQEIKSISNEYTFDEDTGDSGIIESVILGLCEKVSGRLREQNLA